MSSKPFIGIATPQANPTVEIEMRQLLERNATPLATRLTSQGDTPARRLVDYVEQLEDSIATFDTLELGAYAFACTGSSYLVGAAREAELVSAASKRFGLPVVTATAAIAEELKLRGASSMSILAPYPEALVEASVEYWANAGFSIDSVERIDIGQDTRAIYALSDDAVANAVLAFDRGAADVTLLSGTGMPTLTVLKASIEPMVSSNLCLAGAILRRIGALAADQPVDIGDLRHA